jgi:E3 ubiquitin-protein ligase listerin
MVKPKAQARSSRAAADSPGFGLGGSFGFATTSSPLSYLAELPDISVISDANIVVIFKNLFKKDGTTKARALEELAATLTVDSNGQLEVEDAIVDAWVGALLELVHFMTCH